MRIRGRDHGQDGLIRFGGHGPVQVTEEFHEFRVELRAGMQTQLRQRRLMRHRPLGGAVVDHRIVGVGHGQDPGPERDLVRSQPVRIPVRGVALVVMEDDRHNVLEGGRLLQDDLPDARMLDDGPPLA